jgi:hypothetical protein
MVPACLHDYRNRAKTRGDLMIARLLMLGAVALLSFTPANAADDKATCLASCRANLKKTGLWNAYPYGYCRSKCGYPAPAGADKR